MTMQSVSGGITAPDGFFASGVHAGIKSDGRLDLGLLVSDPPAACAAVYTRNRIQGHHIRLCRERLPGHQIAAVWVNSGNANACNGREGLQAAGAMNAAVASMLKVPDASVVNCSTGTIGRPFPVEALKAAVPALQGSLSPTGGGFFANAIMTTDTVQKEVAVTTVIEGRIVCVGGAAKGAGMIEPDMATMLAFVTTDAGLEPDAAGECLRQAVSKSFNRITVDGDQSCNDTVMLFANGASGCRLSPAAGAGWAAFVEALELVCLELAQMIVRDGEGATKFVTVRVTGAANETEADQAAKAVANSLLVKTSWFGEDPNWGRVIDVVGYSGASLSEESIRIRYDDITAYDGAEGPADEDLERLERVLGQDAFTVEIFLGAGEASCEVYTCDCSHDYISINADYTT